jgi:inner membrane protein
MPSFGHVAVGLAAGRFQAQDGPRLRPMLVLTALATFPDLDVVAWSAGAAKHSVWLHRGALHSLAAAAVAALLGAVLLDRGRGFAAALLVCFATAASHGLLDTITHGGSGVMLLWPFSQERFLAPWHPLPASPMGSRLFSPRGLELMAGEAVLFAPLLVYALWPRRGRIQGAMERST